MPIKKLSEEQIKKIRDLKTHGLDPDQISETLGISVKSVLKYSKDINPMTTDEVEKTIEGDNSMAKLKLDLNKVVAKVASEAAEEAFEKKLMDNEDSAQMIEEPLSRSPLEEFFGEGTETSTLKTYKLINGTARYLGDITPEVFQAWDDFEIGFRHYVQQRTLETRNLTNWGDGTYQIKLKTASGDKHRQIELGALTLPEKPIASVLPTKSLDEQLSGFAAMAKIFKDIMPQPSAGGGDFYKELYERQKDEFKELKKSDDMESLASKLESILKVAEKFNKGGESASSPSAEIIKGIFNNLGEVSSLVKGIAESTRNILEMNKRGLLPKPTLNPRQPSKPIAQSAQAQPSQSLPAPYLELFKTLHEMVAADNRNYPLVSQTVLRLFNGDDSVLKNLSLGQITTEQIVGLLQSNYAPFQTPELTPKLSAFIEGFVMFLKNGPYKNLTQPPAQTQSATTTPQTEEPMEAPANAEIIYARCNRCNTEFEYPDKQAYEDDQKNCDNMLLDGLCPGKIELVPDNGGLRPD